MPYRLRASTIVQQPVTGSNRQLAAGTPLAPVEEDLARSRWWLQDPTGHSVIAFRHHGQMTRWLEEHADTVRVINERT